MKKCLLLLTILLLTLPSSPVFAKKTKPQKAELKAWKQRKKAMKPLELKDLVEENHRLKTSQQQLEVEMKAAQAALTKLTKLKVKIDALRAQKFGHAASSTTGQEAKDSTPAGEEDYADLEALFSPQSPAQAGPEGFGSNDWATDKNGQYYLKGLVFKVQMGAYKKRNLSQVLEGEKPEEVFEQEQSAGTHRYTLRHFRNYRKADQFKKELRAMGLKDAWIVAFQDGQRVPLKAVLKAVLKQP